MKNQQQWVPTRQYITGISAFSVEISKGDLEAVNPGFIGAISYDPSLKFEGEGVVYSSATEATKVAIAMRDEWEKVLGEKVYIGIGNTLGGKVHLTPQSPTAVIERARIIDAVGKTCGCCGSVLLLNSELLKVTNSYFDDSIYCSNECAMKAWYLEKEGEEEISPENDLQLMQEHINETLTGI